MDVITTHVNADFDCLGSMIAAKRIYPEAVLVFPGGQERGLRDFLVQSTLYAYDVRRVRDIDLAAITRLILVDVRSAARIGKFAEVARRQDVELHIYDHHPADEHNLHGRIEHIQQVGATVTLMTQLFVERGIHPSTDEATMMMLGLYEDTGHLLFSGTTAADFRAAAFLLEQGANLNTVADFLIREMTPEQVGLLNELLKSCQKVVVKGVEIAIASASLDDYVGDISSLVHKLKDIENLDVLVVAVRMEDRVFLIGRSRLPEVHIGELLQEFGGGGHAFAASATVRDLPLVQLLARLEKLLPQHVQTQISARELMTSPVKTLSSSATIDRAREQLARFAINALPVVDARHHVVGIITRQIVEKAAYHKLGKLALSEVMNSDFRALPPEAPLQRLKEVIIEHNQRCVPVVENQLPIGVVTRTDLLRHILGDRRAQWDPEGEPQRGSVQLKQKNVRKLIEMQLPSSVLTLLWQLGELADAEGVQAYLVGGCVRDLLLRRENLDIDIVVEGDGIAYARAVAENCACRVREHEKFGTAVIIFANGFKIDVASARLEYYASPAALPNVEHASLRQDLYRRDFTINTLTVALNRDNFGQLLDFFGGQRDLKDRSIRVLHNLSFVEDPTRLFRAVRFEQRLGFHVGRQTERLMHSAVRLKLVRKVGGSRLLHELERILDEPRVLAALKRLQQLDLLKFIDAHLPYDEKAEQLLLGAERASSWFDLLYTGEEYRRWLLYLLCLLDRLSDKGVQRTVDWLGIQPRDRDLFLRQRPRGLQLLKQSRPGSDPPRNSEIYHWFAELSLEVILYLMARTENEVMRQWISLYMTHLRRIRISLDGRELIALGLSPGPHFQTIFQALLDKRLNGEIQSRQAEIEWVKKNASQLVDPLPQVE